MTQVDVFPPYTDIASTETLPISFDVTNLLAPGDSITSPTSTLTNLRTGALYAAGLSGSPTVNGNFITQIVTALKAGTQYRLSITFTARANKIWSPDLLLNCPF